MLLAAAALLAACSNEDVPQIASGFPADGVIRVTTHVEAPATRAGMTTENIDCFNIHIKNTANDKYTYYSTYKLQNGVWNSFEEDGTTPLTMLWQSSTQPVTVTAACIQGSSTLESDFTGDKVYSVDPVQNTENGVKAADFVYMAPKQINPATDLTDGKLPVTFVHLLSKVNLTITLGNEFNVTPGTASNPLTNLSVNGTCGSFTWNALNNTGITSPANVRSVNPFAASYTAGAGKTTKAVANYECILVPQTVAANSFSVSFKINGDDYRWISAAPLTFESGKRYKIALSAGKDIVTLDEITASEWGEGTGGNLETE